MVRKLVAFIRRRPWLSILALIYLAGMIAVSIPKSMEKTENSDYWVFWQSGKDFSDKHALYYREKNRPFYYPPFAAFFFQPLHILSLPCSALVFFLLNALILFPLAIYLLYRILRIAGLPGRKAERVLFLATLLTLKYFWNNLVMFQVNFLLFVIVLLGIYFLARKQPHISGILLTVIAFIKLMPVILAAWVFIFHFSRRVLISIVLTVLLCLTLPAAFRGVERWIDDHGDYTETFIRSYVLEGRIVADQANHSLKAGLFKSFHPESRNVPYVYPGQFPLTGMLASILQFILFAVLFVNGVKLFRRKLPFSLSYLVSILVFTHLVAGITWTAHLVTLMLCILPVLLMDPGALRIPGRIAYYLFIAIMVFLGVEGSDTFGEKIYLAIRYYDVYTVLLLGLFVFCSWVVWSRRSARIYPEGFQY